MSATQPQRKQAARLPRPAARYWKGKAPKGASDLPSSDESDTEDQDPSLQREPEEPGDEFIDTVEDEEEEEERAAPVAVATEGVRGKVQGVKVALRDVNISKEGRVIVAGKVESGKTQVEIEEEEEEEEEDDDEAEGKIAEDEEEASNCARTRTLVEC